MALAIKYLYFYPCIYIHIFMSILVPSISVSIQSLPLYVNYNKGEKDTKKLLYIRYFLAPSPKHNHFPSIPKRKTQLIFTAWRLDLTRANTLIQLTLGIAQEAENLTWGDKGVCSESGYSTSGSGA